MDTNINFLSYLAQFLLEWKLFRTKVVQKLETHILYSITFFRKSCRLWEKVKKIYILEWWKPQITRCMRIACWIPKATNTHNDCVILVAFPLQQWLYERASMLRYTHSACLVKYVVVRVSDSGMGSWQPLVNEFHWSNRNILPFSTYNIGVQAF